MKILLINPTERKLLRANLPEEIEGVRGRNQPIGLLYIAAAARRIDGADVRILDAHAENLDMMALRREVAQFQPDVAGLTCVTLNMPDVLDCAAAVKDGAPNARVILGGLQPFLYPEESFRLPNIDGLIRGEAEQAFPAYLQNMDETNALREIPGLKIRTAGEEIDTGIAPPIEELDSLPPPAVDLLRAELYDSVITDIRPTINLITSRGCPYSCRFCSRSVTGKRFRAHGAERVVSDVRASLDLGYRCVLFYDEVFTIKRQRVADICRIIREERLRFPWMARATVSTVDADLLTDMKKAGCFLVTFGVESGSERILNEMNRPATNSADIRRAFADARRAGLQTLAYFMVGLPGETEDDLRLTWSLLRDIDPDHAHISVFVPYPATDYYDEALRTKLFARDVWHDFSARPTGEFHAPTWPQSPSAERLFAVVRRFYRRFYLRPSKLLRQLKEIRSLADILKRVPYLRALLNP